MEQGRTTPMSPPTAFAAWVEPLAMQMRGARAEVIEFARSATSGFWEQAPRGFEGWTNKDLLAHIGGGNDQMVQIALRAVVAGEPIDVELESMDIDAENKRAIEERHDWAIDRVIAELESTGEEMQKLLSRLREEHRDVPLAALKITLEQLLAIVQAEDHDREHLAQLRTVMERSG